MISWLYQHGAAILRALRQLITQPLSTALSVLVLGISLALPATGYVVLETFSKLVKGLSTSPEISLFLLENQGETAIFSVQERLENLGERIQEWHFIPKEKALERLRASELGDLVEGIEPNPLPDAFVITPHSTAPDEHEALYTLFQSWPEIEQVVSDASWTRRLHAIINLAHMGVMVLAVLLGATLVIVTFNTIRLQLLDRHQEIEVSHLLGATPTFVRRPFYWFGALQGIFGGVFALVAVELIVFFLRPHVADLARAYAMSAQLMAPSLTESVVVILFATLLGWLGSALALRSYAKK
jgi:cell division transport system permease protein